MQWMLGFTLAARAIHPCVPTDMSVHRATQQAQPICEANTMNGHATHADFMNSNGHPSPVHILDERQVTDHSSLSKIPDEKKATMWM